MTQRLFLAVAAAALLASGLARSANADVRREQTDRRPYIVEIGEPYSIAMSTLRHEADSMNELDEYLRMYGYPDYAEVQEVEPEWPWESYEVRMYYMRRNLETAFGHVFLSAALPNLGVLKFQASIEGEKRHQIEIILQSRVSPPPAPVVVAAIPVEAAAPPEPAPPQASSGGGISEAVVARLEAAAERAAQAADRAAAESDAAARAADRTENIVDRMEQTVAPRRRSH